MLNLFLSYCAVGNLDTRRHKRQLSTFGQGQLIHKNHGGEVTELSILIMLARK